MKGKTIEVNKEPLHNLVEVLTEKKRTGEIPGSITNTTPAML
jgi:hypothetical protein